MHRVLVFLLFIVAFFVLRLDSGHAQPAGTCPALVERALTLVEEACSQTGRNQVCYGHSVLLAEQRPEIERVLLNTPGDITEIYNLNRLRLFAMNLEMNHWGVAMMRVQANLPDSLPGQNVLFMLFGDVEIAPISSTELADVSVSTPLLPMQRPVRAFRLRTGIGRPECQQAPPDGVLVQTPHGLGRVELTINGIDISLGSTVFLHMPRENALTVSTLEGSALLSAAGGESLALAGSEVSIPLTASFQPAAPPALPEPYVEESFSALPLSSLERPIQAHAPLARQELAAVRQAVREGRARDLLPDDPTPRTPQPDACPGNSCAAPGHTANNGNNGNGGNNPNGNGGNCPGNSCNSNGSSGNGQANGGSGNGGNSGNNNGQGNNGNGNGNSGNPGGDCPGNSCSSNGSPGNGQGNSGGSGERSANANAPPNDGGNGNNGGGGNNGNSNGQGNNGNGNGNGGGGGNGNRQG